MSTSHFKNAYDQERVQVVFIYDILHRMFVNARPGTSDKKMVKDDRNKSFMIPSLGEKRVGLLNDVIKRNKKNLRLIIEKYFFIINLERFYLKYLSYKFANFQFFRLISPIYTLDTLTTDYKRRPQHYELYQFNPNKTAFIYAVINYIKDGHAIFIHYNDAKRRFQMYDPNGGLSGKYTSKIHHAGVIFLREFQYHIEKRHPRYKFSFVKCDDACLPKGIQVVEMNYRPENDNIDDIDGYCLTNSMLMIHLCALNNSDDFKMMERMLLKAYPPGAALSNIIREYYLFMLNLIYKIASFAMSLNSKFKNYFIGDFYSRDVIGCIAHNKNCDVLRNFYNDPEKYIQRKYNKTQLLAEITFGPNREFLVHSFVSADKQTFLIYIEADKLMN